MKNRCEQPEHVMYKHYGARGIKVCERWEQFENFYSDMGPRPDGLTLERNDNEKGYSLSNCRWATQTEQANNKRTNIYLEKDGETHSIAVWSRKLGLNRHTLYTRYHRGWAPEEILR
jgi:hypothetical protein